MSITCCHKKYGFMYDFFPTECWYQICEHRHDYKKVLKLIENDEDKLHELDRDERNAIYWCQHNARLCKYFIKSGLDPHQEDKHGNNLLNLVKNRELLIYLLLIGVEIKTYHIQNPKRDKDIQNLYYKVYQNQKINQFYKGNEYYKTIYDLTKKQRRNIINGDYKQDLKELVAKTIIKYCYQKYHLKWEV